MLVGGHNFVADLLPTFRQPPFHIVAAPQARSRKLARVALPRRRQPPGARVTEEREVAKSIDTCKYPTHARRCRLLSGSARAEPLFAVQAHGKLTANTERVGALVLVYPA